MGFKRTADCVERVHLYHLYNLYRGIHLYMFPGVNKFAVLKEGEK